MHWDPDKYNLFQKERFAPFDDLSRMVQVREGLRVIDLGCGTGELTARLSDMLPRSNIVGIDASPAMLDRADSRAREGLSFEVGAIEEVGGAWDLVFSNAAIHWVDGHETLIPKLFALLRPGGQLLVQLPSNHAHPAHLMIAELARREPFRTALHGWTRRVSVLSPERYAEILYACEARGLTIFEKIYPHELEDSDALSDWLSGTTMLPYLERLPAGMKDVFMETFRSELRRYWPTGPIFYGFKRILFSACREEPGEDVA
jgi:trans-aconitate 2-methyltransferase